MTTFILMLPPDASAAMVNRILAELEAAFPQHEFIARDSDDAYEEALILEVCGSADEPEIVRAPTTDHAADVNEAFKSILDDLKGWKPS